MNTEAYERGFIDGMQKQMQSSVDKAVNAMSKREWVGLTDEEIEIVSGDYTESEGFKHGARWALDRLKEKNT
jgi:hypothetical protein